MNPTPPPNDVDPDGFPQEPPSKQTAEEREAEARAIAAMEAAALARAAASRASRAAATARPAQQRKPSPLHRLRTVLVCALALSAGVAGRVAIHGLKGAERPASAQPQSPLHPDKVDPERVDVLIQSGGFDEALKLCQAGLNDGASRADRGLAYRRGLCLEALKQWKEAGAAYQQAAGSPSGGVAGWARATLGQARCAAAEGDTRAARNLLNRVVLQSGHPACRDGNVLGECLYLRARLALLESGPFSTPNPLNVNAIAWPSFDGGVDQYPAWLPDDTLDSQPGLTASTNPVAVEVHRYRWSPDLLESTVRVVDTPVADLLRAIGAAAGMACHVSPEAASLLASEGAVSVDVHRAPLPEVLTALADPVGVKWRIEERAMVFDTAPPSKAGRHQALRESLWRAVAVAPGHPRVRATRVALANLTYEADRRKEAGGAFKQFLDDEPNSPEAVQAGYNLGLIELQNASFATARARFYDVVDRGQRTQWASLGWWWIGRTHLDAGDTHAARKAFQTVLADASAKEFVSAAKLGLILCTLLEGDDDATKALLRDARIPNRNAHNETAEWFKALVRYRSTPSAGRADELVAAIRDGHGGRWLGPAGVYLAGRAYREIGRPDLMAGEYERAVASVRGPLAMRMTFDIAEFLYQEDRLSQARQRYLAVAVVDREGLGPRAELRLAEIAARGGDGAECVRWCRDAVGRPGVEVSEVLAVMGRGYEMQGKYRLAAECFAGRLPDR